MFFIIDFDSTFVKLESIDELAKIAITDIKKREEIFQQIVNITNSCMDGEITITESLSRRLKLINPNRENIAELIQLLKGNVTDSFIANREFLQNYSDRIYIVSNGFVDFILPVVAEYGITHEHVLANNFVYDESGAVIGMDESNDLSKHNGKSIAIKKLNLSGNIVVIGDGYTDYEVKLSGVAKEFYAFVENVSRAKVVAKADYVVKTLDEFLVCCKQKEN